MKKLSVFQWEHFRPMIPGIFTEYRENGPGTGEFYLKLLGGGDPVAGTGHASGSRL